MSKSIASALAAVSAIAAIATPAAAETQRDEVSVRVSYRGLDLTTERGANRLLNRIENAAERACGSNEGRLTLAERRAARACEAEAMQRTVASLNDTMVTRQYLARGGELPNIDVASAE
jgi:UrcA family protein